MIISMRIMMFMIGLVVGQTTAPPAPPAPTTAPPAPPAPVPTTVVVVVPTTVVVVPATTIAPVTTRTPPSAVFTPNPTTRSSSTPTTTNTQDQLVNTGSQGLSAGIIAGIVIGSLIVVFGLVSYGINVFQKRKANDSTLLEMTSTTTSGGNSGARGAGNMVAGAGVLGAVNHARKEQQPVQQYGNQGSQAGYSRSQVGYSGAQAGYVRNGSVPGSQTGYNGTGSQAGAYSDGGSQAGYAPSFPAQSYPAANPDGSYNNYYAQYYDPSNPQQQPYTDQQNYGYYGEYSQEEIDEWNRQQQEYDAQNGGQNWAPSSAGIPDKPLPKPQ